MRFFQFTLALLFSLSISAPATAQDDVSGVWYGTITQHPRGLDTIYDFRISLEAKGDSVYGVSLINMQGEDAEYWGRMDIEGEMKDGKLKIYEVTLIDENLFAFAYWCFKTLYLEPEVEDGKAVLKGHWRSLDCNGSRGNIRLEREIS